MMGAEHYQGFRLPPTVHAKEPPPPTYGAQCSPSPLQRRPVFAPPTPRELAPPHMGGGRTDSPHPLARRR